MGVGGNKRGRPVAMRSHPPFLFLEEHTDMTDGMNVSQTNLLYMQLELKLYAASIATVLELGYNVVLLRVNSEGEKL